MYFHRIGICPSVLVDPEHLMGWPSVSHVGDGVYYLEIEQSERSGCVPRSVKYFLCFHLLDWSFNSVMLCTELLEVLRRVPTRTPEQIVCSIVEPITIKVDRRIKVKRSRCRDKGSSDQDRDRALELNSSTIEADIDYSSLVHMAGHQPTTIFVSYEPGVTYRVVREFQNLSPFFLQRAPTTFLDELDVSA